MFEPHKSLHCSLFRMSRSCRHDCRLIIEGINLSVRVERGTVSQGTKRVGDRASTLTLSKHDSVAVPLTVVATQTRSAATFKRGVLQMIRKYTLLLTRFI